MQGLMQERPLLISSLIEHANHYHPGVEIVSRTTEGPIHRCTYGDIHRRAKQVTNALTALGIGTGDRIGTLAWNGYRHMELYYAVSGSGAVLHTLNPRLHPDQVVWIADHAEDQVLFFDLTFLPLIEAIASRVKTIKAFVAMTDRAHMAAATSIPNLLCYEELIADAPECFDWPSFDENTASSLCYTSGTTGNPKGVVHSHRTLLDRAKAGADFDKLTNREEVLAYLPPAWIGQNIFSYAQWLACGYIVNCPESASTVMIDLKEIGPTYYFAPPRIFEGLLTSVTIRMEDASRLKKWLYDACMAVARRVGPALMDGKPVSFVDRVKYKLGDWFIFGPLRNTLGFSRVPLYSESPENLVGYVEASDLLWGRDAPDLRRLRRLHHHLLEFGDGLCSLADQLTTVSRRWTRFYYRRFPNRDRFAQRKRQRGRFSSSRRQDRLCETGLAESDRVL